MVCGLLGILTACTLLSSSCQRLLSYIVAYCPTVIATVNDSLADGYLSPPPPFPTRRKFTVVSRFDSELAHPHLEEQVCAREADVSDDRGAHCSDLTSGTL